MILYHGSNVFIEKIDVQKCRPFKDFGRGFYCTELKEQAEQMAKRVAFIYGGSPCVTIWEMNDEALISSELNIKTFTESSKEWAMFVLNNRNRDFTEYDSAECNHDNKYDIVTGPVANDDLALLFRTFTNGFIDMDALVKGMKYKRLSEQISFHTEKALCYLKPIT
ncbi:MAG: hypothetical protein CVU90_12355 [Firmicutes bacterium HGW-Firmicutes-15]|nr:MAG: hypothetical protein CVU90_12355 [Firmicutes bacterium HGW-Firmicutes-15]